MSEKNKIARRLHKGATDKAKELFGDIVESVWVAVELTDSRTSRMSIDELLADDAPNVDDESIQISTCGQIWMLFTNGKMVEFSISEWGFISAARIEHSYVT